MKKSEIGIYMAHLNETAARVLLRRQLEEGYTLVKWPESQAFMDKPWFRKEAILDVDGKHGSSAYLIPTFRTIGSSEDIKKE